MAHYEGLGGKIWFMHAEHATDRPIVAAVQGTRRTMLIDAGNSPAHAAAFREELDRKGIRQPELGVLTHWHWDHTFGMEEWGIPYAAQEGTARALSHLTGVKEWNGDTLERLIREGYASDRTARHLQAEYGESLDGIRIRVPDIVFRESLVLDLGDVTCRVDHVGGDHTPDSCFVYVVEEKVLFLGDALGPSVYGGPRKYEADRFLGLLERVRTYGAEWIVESHGVPMDRKTFELDVEPWAELARTVRDLPGATREQVTDELVRRLGTSELPAGLGESVEFFLEGRNG